MNDKERETEKVLFDRAKAEWGIDAQVYMLAEESAELAVAALHLERKLKDPAVSWDNFAEEIADVEFMVAEMRHYFPKLDAEIDKARAKKRERLTVLLNRGRLK